MSTDGGHPDDGPAALFESAADAVVNGDVAALEALLAADPSLVRARSTRSHRATLLHYVAANGVEDSRQRTPTNIVDVASRLLDAGAEADALALAYGGDWPTTLELVVSSVHPARAGVEVALIEALVDHGAAVSGVQGDGAPLLTALAFHGLRAAEALARRGARVDDVVSAAGLGRADLVAAMVEPDGALAPGVRLIDVGWLGLSEDPASHLERALVFAAWFGHTRVVSLLLDRGVDPAARDPRSFTALHWACYYGHVDAARTLLDRGAPLEAENCHGGTPLGQTVWAAVHQPGAGDHALVVELLVAAGAHVDAAGLPSGHPVIDSILTRARSG